MSQALVKKERFGQVIAAQFKQITSVLPATMDQARFCRLSLGLLDKVPKLLQCSPQSFGLAVMALAELGLEPILGQAYVIPYGQQATVQIGYQGMIDLALRSSRVFNIYADVVREGDEFIVTYGTNRSIHHLKIGERDAPLTHAYAVADIGHGRETFEVLHRDDILKRRSVSKTANFNDSPWNEWEEEMWKKTAVRYLYKYLPKSAQMSAAVELDNTSDMGRQAQPAGLKDLDLSGFNESAPWDEAAPEPEPEPKVTKANKGKDKDGGLV
jgi:recombination protein RecT